MTWVVVVRLGMVVRMMMRRRWGRAVRVVVRWRCRVQVVVCRGNVCPRRRPVLRSSWWHDVGGCPWRARVRSGWDLWVRRVRRGGRCATGLTPHNRSTTTNTHANHEFVSTNVAHLSDLTLVLVVRKLDNEWSCRPFHDECVVQMINRLDGRFAVRVTQKCRTLRCPIRGTDHVNFSNFTKGCKQVAQFGFSRFAGQHPDEQFVFGRRRRFGRFDLCRTTCPRKRKLVVQRILCYQRVRRTPIGDKGTPSVQTSVFVTNDRYILEWSKRIKGREDVFLTEVLGDLLVGGGGGGGGGLDWIG